MKYSLAQLVQMQEQHEDAMWEEMGFKLVTGHGDLSELLLIGTFIIRTNTCKKFRRHADAIDISRQAVDAVYKFAESLNPREKVVFTHVFLGADLRKNMNYLPHNNGGAIYQRLIKMGLGEYTTVDEKKFICAIDESLLAEAETYVMTHYSQHSKLTEIRESLKKIETIITKTIDGHI